MKDWETTGDRYEAPPIFCPSKSRIPLRGGAFRRRLRPTWQIALHTRSSEKIVALLIRRKGSRSRRKLSACCSSSASTVPRMFSLRTPSGRGNRPLASGGCCSLASLVGGVAAGSYVALGLLGSPAGAAGCLSVGPAEYYSEYATNGVSQSSDTVAGAAAYGGPSNSVSGLHVGSALTPSAISLVLGASSTVNNTVLPSMEVLSTWAPSAVEAGTPAPSLRNSSQSSLPIQFGPAQTSLQPPSPASAH